MISNRYDSAKVDNDGEEIDFLKAEIDELQNILIVAGVVLVIFPIIFCGRKFTKMLRKLNQLFQGLIKARSQNDNIPMTIIEEPTAEKTNDEIDQDQEDEQGNSKSEGLLIATGSKDASPAIPTAPEKIG